MYILICDTEAVFTEDGPPQPRSSVFVECLDVTCECEGKFILRGDEISDYVDNAEELMKNLNELLKEMEEHRSRYTNENAKTGDPYWRGRRDEAGHFRDKLSKLLHKATG